MVRRKGISLRYKILITLTLLPLIALGVYLLMAIRVFKSDKLAYVFDSSVAVSRTISAQIRSELSSLVNQIRPIVQGVDRKTNEIADFSRGIFENNEVFEYFSFYKLKKDGKGYEQKGKLSKDNQLEAELLQDKGRVDRWIDFIRQRGVIARKPFNDDRLLIGARIGSLKSWDHLVVFFVVRRREFIDVFKVAKTHSLYLMDEKGAIFFGPNEKNQLSSVTNSSFVFDSVANRIYEGTAEVNSLSGEDMLASFSHVGFGDLVVVAFVVKDVALKAVQTLLRQSSLFFIILFATTIIISVLASGRLTSALSGLFSATNQISEGNFDIKINVNSNDEIGSLADNFNSMAQEVSRLMAENMEKARMEGELKTAQTVQETLFPAAQASIEGIKVAGYYEPASECGGDWWHYCTIGKRTFFWIGDATGHGAPAALITSAARSAASILERINVNPGKALELLNQAIYDVSKGRLMMTFFLGCYDPETETFTYSNGSHDPPYLFEKGTDKLKKKHLTPLMEVNNPRLGQDRDTVYKETSIQFLPGHTIFFYTDGIPEMYNKEGEMWGERKFLKALINSNQDFPDAEVVVERMTKEIKEFRGDADLQDDVTFFMIRRES